MSADQMQMLGTVLIGTGLAFFIITQVFLNIWEKGYRAETRRL